MPTSFSPPLQSEYCCASGVPPRPPPIDAITGLLSRGFISGSDRSTHYATQTRRHTDTDTHKHGAADVLKNFESSKHNEQRARESNKQQTWANLSARRPAAAFLPYVRNGRSLETAWASAGVRPKTSINAGSCGFIVISVSQTATVVVPARGGGGARVTATTKYVSHFHFSAEEASGVHPKTLRSRQLLIRSTHIHTLLVRPRWMSCPLSLESPVLENRKPHACTPPPSSDHCPTTPRKRAHAIE